jgi:sugar (pentulose or hexulose) kinase
VSIKEYMLHRLTGIWVLDLGLASTTGLLNMH